MSIEQFYQEIGQEAFNHAEGLSGTLLIYAEVEDGAISADMFYVNQDNTVRFMFCSSSMQELIYSFWENWKVLPDHQAWGAMCYSINDGKFNIAYFYPEQMSPDEGLSERRLKVIKQYFGDMSVDYTCPE